MYTSEHITSLTLNFTIMYTNLYKLVIGIILSVFLFGGTYFCTFESIDHSYASSHEIDGYLPFRGEISIWNEDVEVRGESHKFILCKESPEFTFDIFTQENVFGARRLVAIVK